MGNTIYVPLRSSVDLHLYIKLNNDLRVDLDDNRLVSDALLLIQSSGIISDTS